MTFVFIFVWFLKRFLDNEVQLTVKHSFSLKIFLHEAFVNPEDIRKIFESGGEIRIAEIIILKII